MEIDPKAERILRGTLYVPGYCENPEADRPILNIRIFSDDETEIICAFSKWKIMWQYFKGTDLERMRYMKLRSPAHFEAAHNLGKELVVDPGSTSEIRFSHALLQEIMREGVADESFCSGNSESWKKLRKRLKEKWLRRRDSNPRPAG